MPSMNKTMARWMKGEDQVGQGLTVPLGVNQWRELYFAIHCIVDEDHRQDGDAAKHIERQ